jgi:anti-sigma factor RsiW
MAATIVVAIGGAALLVRSASRGASAEAVTGDVVNAHIRSLMANHLFDVQSTDQHTVKPWFLGKIDFAPPVVDLAAAGFPLVGGRLDYVNGRPAAALVYQRQQHTINVFIWRASDDAGVREQATTLRGFHVRRWTTGGLSFSAVSDLNDAELAAFVGALQSS